MPIQSWKVGDLAKRTGLTVRTLHHYDEIGLLKPSLHSGSGYRLYTAADLARLQRIVSLRQLGFSLDEIKSCLDQPDFSSLGVIKLHAVRLKEQIELERKLCERLEALAAHFQAAEEVSADELFTTIEAMNMIEKYYTPEQLEYLEKRRAEVGQEVIDQGPQQWNDLFADVQQAVDAGVDPASPQGAALAQRWLELVSGFTGGDPSIFQSLKKMYETETTVAGMDVKAMQPTNDFIQRAAAAAGIKHPE